LDHPKSKPTAKYAFLIVAYLCTSLYCYTLRKAALCVDSTMKNERHNAIRQLLSEGPVVSQDQLRRKLVRRGFDVTQATLSRDIHDLRLYKGPNGYAVPNGASGNDDLPSLDDVFTNFGLAVRQATNQLVLRTTTGSAQPVAAALDHERIPDVLGTIAGDDTVLIICQDQKHASSLRHRLENLLEA
jgi:transcriptional regulator of arginine metabolism